MRSLDKKVEQIYLSTFLFTFCFIADSDVFKGPTFHIVANIVFEIPCSGGYVYNSSLSWGLHTASN